MNPTDIEDLLVQSIYENLNNKEILTSILRFTIELRESAKENKDYNLYDNISIKLKKIGIDLIEESFVKVKLPNT